MKQSKEKIIKGFKAVDFMRKVRDKISYDIQEMDFEQIKEYFENRRCKLTLTKSKDG